MTPALWLLFVWIVTLAAADLIFLQTGKPTISSSLRALSDNNPELSFVIWALLGYLAWHLVGASRHPQ